MTFTLTKRLILLLGLITVLSSFIVSADSNFSANVNSKGDISLPSDFRANMVHLGSWFVPEGGASGFHDVYTEKRSVEAYRKTGQFPDGATLVKELRAATEGDYTTGKAVKFANSTVKQWFVMVKDSKGRFKNNANWGDGWGWALFKTDGSLQNASSDYKADCLGCHVPVKQKDWVYSEAYPTLVK